MSATPRAVAIAVALLALVPPLTGCLQGVEAPPMRLTDQGPREPVAVAVSNGGLVVDGRPTPVKGVAYPPTNSDEYHADAYRDHLPQLKGMGANAILVEASRTRPEALHGILDAAARYHLGALVELPVAEQADASHAADRATVRGEALDVVDALKDHPAVWAWVLPARRQPDNASQWYYLSLMDEITRAAGEADPRHPVAASAASPGAAARVADLVPHAGLLLVHAPPTPHGWNGGLREGRVADRLALTRVAPAATGPGGGPGGGGAVAPATAVEAWRVLRDGGAPGLVTPWKAAGAAGLAAALQPEWGDIAAPVPPTIAELTSETDGDVVRVRARVTSYGDVPVEVSLNHRTKAGPWQVTAMTREGDAFTATVGPVEDGVDIVFYNVRAVDRAGREAHSDTFTARAVPGADAALTLLAAAALAVALARRRGST